MTTTTTTATRTATANSATSYGPTDLQFYLALLLCIALVVVGGDVAFHSAVHAFLGGR